MKTLMYTIRVVFFLIFVCGGFFIGIHLAYNVYWFKYFSGCILGSIVGWVLWVIACSLFKRKRTSIEKPNLK